MDKDKKYKTNQDMPEDKVSKEEAKDIGDILEKTKDVEGQENQDKSKKDFGKGSEGKF